MVQRFPELYRVYQCVAIDVGLVMKMQFLAAEMKCGDLLAVGLEPDLGKIPAHAQIKRASEDVRGLKACQMKSPPFIMDS